MIRPSIADVRQFFSLLAVCALALGVWLSGVSVAERIAFRAESAAGTLLVRVTSPAGPAALEDAAARLRSLPEVVTAAPLSAARVKALLESAGGDALDPDSLPATRLIEVRARAGPETDVHVGRALRAAGFEAEIFSTTPDRSAAQRQAGAILFLAAMAVLIGGLVIAFMVVTTTARAPEPAVAVEIGLSRAVLLSAFGRAGAETGFAAGLAALALCAVGAPLVLAALAEPISLDRLISDAPGMLSQIEAASGLLAPLLLGALCARAARAGAAMAFDRLDQAG